jgi:cytochrome c peroxidase
MLSRWMKFGWAGIGVLCMALLLWKLGATQGAQVGEPPPKGPTYMRVLEQDFDAVRKSDIAEKPKVMERQRTLLAARYDLTDRPAAGLMMSGGRKAVQQGIRVKLPGGMTWEQLATMSPDEIRAKDLFPQGFLPLPHVKHETGGFIFPDFEINEINKQEGRPLQRFDADFDLPNHLVPEFPPPIFLTTRPELGDVSKGELLTIKNFFSIMDGILTPVQMEGLRLLLTPFPQQQFNGTDDRKVDAASLGATCLDCHANGHTNGTFHLNPDNRPQAARFRIETVSLRGMFNQNIHGSKRSLRSVEDFTEFEQRTAYFDGDHVIAAKKGANFPDRTSQVAMMAQIQNMFDFPPAPKLNVLGRLDRARATKEELLGEEVFFGKGQCGACHPAPFYLDDKMNDLKVERFYTPRTINGEWIHAEGPIKTFTLRGIKDSPPYLHDGRLLTLEDTVEFFNLVLGVKLTTQEKAALVAFMRTL